MIEGTRQAGQATPEVVTEAAETFAAQTLDRERSEITYVPCEIRNESKLLWGTTKTPLVESMRMWPFKKTTGLERAAQRYMLAFEALLRSDPDELHPYHVALCAVAYGLREAADGFKRDSNMWRTEWRIDPVAHLALRQALWFDGSRHVVTENESLRAVQRDALLEAGLVLHREITGRAMCLREHEKYTKGFQQALDAFPRMRAAWRDEEAFPAASASLAIACGYPFDPIIVTCVTGRYIAFIRIMLPMLTGFSLGNKDDILDRTGQVPFRDWLELAVAEGERVSGG